MTEHKGARLLEGSDVTLGVVLPNGKSAAFDFVAALPRVVQARFKRFFERLQDNIPIKSPEHMRHLDTDAHGNELHELKNHKPAVRLYIVKIASPTGATKWVVTHGVDKVKDNRVPAEMDRSWGIFYTWLNSE